jgi:hypothetical protein
MTNSRKTSQKPVAATSTEEQRQALQAAMVAGRQTPAVKRVRATLKKRLDGQFAAFLKYASIADLYLIGEVLSFHEKHALSFICPSSASATPELRLPDAFDAQIERGVPCFVPVPERFLSDVERYVSVLTAERRPRRKR